MNQYFIGAEELLEDAHQLTLKVLKSGFYPTYGIGIWRVRAPIALAVHELLCFLGVYAKHTPIKISSYDGLTRGDKVTIYELTPLCEMISGNDSLLVVNEAHDTAHPMEHLLTNMQNMFLRSNFYVLSQKYELPQPISNQIEMRQKKNQTTSCIKTVTGLFSS